MEALNDNRADEGGCVGNLAAMCATLLPLTPHKGLSSSYQYKNSALSIEQIKPQNRTNKTSKLKNSSKNK